MEINFLKDIAVCKNCYYKKNRKNKINTLIQNQQPKTDNVFTDNNNRTHLVGLSFSGKTLLMLKVLSRIPPDRQIYKTTKSPPEPYSIFKINNKEIGEEIKTINEYENAILGFDDILGSTNSRYIDQFFVGVRHNKLDFYYLSESYFDFPKRTIRNNSNKKF